MSRLTSLLLLFSLFLPTLTPSTAQAPAFGAPVLKWQLGGCDDIWCENGWYSSPAVADLDGDGIPEVVGANYPVYILDGQTGALEHESNAEGGRQWPSLVLADLESDGDLEIVTAHEGGWLNVFDEQLNLVWAQQVTPGSELRSLATYDLEGDGDLEIMVAATRSQDQWYVFEHTGALRSGSWPQHSPDSDTNGYTAGCYNENVAAGDLDGDGRAEIIGPNDTHYIAAFQDDGQQMLASTIYGLNDDQTPKVWSRVGVHVDHQVDLNGFAECGSEHRPNFDEAGPIIVDVNGDGVLEAIVVGSVYNCGTDPYTDLYEIPYILNGDRTRWQGSGFNWTVLPAPDGSAAPISQDYNVIENNQPNAVAADLDGDGKLEILHSSYDGRIHAYWLDKSEHGNWPYSVYNPAEGFLRFGSEPTVVDLDADGQAEVIFASWVQKGSGQVGKLHILSSQGVPVYEVPLPPPSREDRTWNGALAAPTIADIDGDPDLEVVLNTYASGLVAYDLPGTADARPLWPTGRGSYLRSGSILRGSLASSQKSASRSQADPGDALHYTITLRNPGPLLSTVSMTDTLPAGLTYTGGLSATSGAPDYANGAVTWQGQVAPGQPVSIVFDVSIDAGISDPTRILNQAVVNDGADNLTHLSAATYVLGYGVYLPLVDR